jgi:hypothetical protein
MSFLPGERGPAGGKEDCLVRGSSVTRNDPRDLPDRPSLRHLKLEANGG